MISQQTYLTILSYTISLVPLHLLCQQFIWLTAVAKTNTIWSAGICEKHVCAVFLPSTLPCSSSSSGSFDDSFKTIAAERESVTLREICKYMSLCLVCLCMRWEVSIAVWSFMLWKSGLWHFIFMQEVGFASKDPSTSGYILCSLLALAEQVIWELPVKALWKVV